MVNIILNEDTIIAIGHAENKPICGLFSGMCAFVQVGLSRVGDGDAMSLEYGCMVVDRHKVMSAEGRYLIATLGDSLECLSQEYPHSFMVRSE